MKEKIGSQVVKMIRAATKSVLFSQSIETTFSLSAENWSDGAFELSH